MRRWATAVLTLVLTALSAADAGAAPLRATLISVADDPRFERSRIERAYLGHASGSARDGVAVALEEAKLELDAAGSTVVLDTAAANSVDQARSLAQQAEKNGAAVLLLELPAAWTLAAAAAVKIPVINLADASDTLREKDCRANLLHTLPSERMRVDALAQTLLARQWSQVLLLSGPSADDSTRAATVLQALKRSGLKLVAHKPFKLSADPRERALANPALLTNGLAYDVVWVVDSDGELARSLPYRTALPRPVVGDAGLTALAWHAQFERFGAPQVSRRFAKAAKRTMTAHDWAAWVAGRALVAAALAAPNGPASAWAKALASASLDGSKGVALSFRAWDGQLRQPLLLSDGQAVLGMAPLEAVLHPTQVLDTLGADAPERRCKFKP
jgi:ABC transporter substrate binding protein (PQQ-dependent alcohol dehydrogenase system)